MFLYIWIQLTTSSPATQEVNELHLLDHIPMQNYERELNQNRRKLPMDSDQKTRMQFWSSPIKRKSSKNLSDEGQSHV